MRGACRWPLHENNCVHVLPPRTWYVLSPLHMDELASRSSCSKSCETIFCVFTDRLKPGSVVLWLISCDEKPILPYARSSARIPAHIECSVKYERSVFWTVRETKHIR